MTKAEYIRQMYSILSPMCFKYGFNNVAAGMIAQSIQEGWNSGLATKYHNYWGMKAGSSYKGQTVAMNNKAKTDPAVYRVFNSMQEGCEGYFAFLSYPRYQTLKKCPNDIDFLNKIGGCGWNGNPGYGERCISHLKEVYSAIQQTLQPILSWQVGRTYTTGQDLYVREEPNGKKVKFGQLTENAKLHAKKDLFGNAILLNGTRVTCKDVVTTESCVWLRIPSGYICAKNSKHIYVL